jgi:type IV secretory pathway TraG/TraD family ATPase VirD4
LTVEQIPPSLPTVADGSGCDLSDHMHIAREWFRETGKRGAPVTYDLSSNILIYGPPGCGKGACLELLNWLLHLRNTSVISIDPSGQNAAVGNKARRKAGIPCLALNPMQMHVEQYSDLASVGCNPLLAGIDIEGPRAFEETTVIVDAFDWGDTQKDPFFGNAGKKLGYAVTAHVRKRDGDNSHIGTVLELLMEGDEWADGPDGRVLVKGLSLTAAEIVEAYSGNPKFQWIANLAGQFLGGPNSSTRTTDSIRQTAQTAAQSLLSPLISRDLAKNGVDWDRLTEEAVTLSLILPAEVLEFHAVYLRLILACALNRIYRKAGKVKVRTLFLLSEAHALGKMGSTLTATSQGGKFGIRIASVWQNWTQLVDLYGPNGAAVFMANAPCKIAFRPSERETADMLSRHTGNHPVIHQSYNEDRDGNVSVGTTVQMEPLWPPEAIMSLPRWHGLVWFDQDDPPPGQPRAPVAVRFRPYFKDRDALRAARPDPYPLRR